MYKFMVATQYNYCYFKNKFIIIGAEINILTSDVFLLLYF